ncbi:MAG: hypothetical protein AAGH74_16770 [Pseudomonadota bacterium]
MLGLLIHCRTVRASDPCIIFCSERIEANVWLAGYLSQSDVDRLVLSQGRLTDAEVDWQNNLLWRFGRTDMLLDISEYIYTRSDLTKEDVIDREKLTRSVTRLDPPKQAGDQEMFDQAFALVKEIISDRAEDLMTQQ